MKAIKNIALAGIVLALMAPFMTASAQGPVIKRIEFTINAPFEVKDSNVVLAPGKYILLQTFQQHPNVFYLYQNDLMHRPIATVQTARIDYGNGKYPSKTRMLLDMNEETMTALPVIKGWNIPGYDGWEIISTVMDRNRASIARNYSRHSRPVQATIIFWQ